MRIARRLRCAEEHAGGVLLVTDAVEIRLPLLGDDVLRIRAGSS